MALFKIIGDEPVLPCVFRIEAGKKFFIWKSPDLAKTLKSLSEDLERKAKKAPPSTDLFFKLASYIRTYRPNFLKVIVLFQIENHVNLIKFEMDELVKAEKDPECLNNSFLPYQPTWINISENKAIKATLPKSKVIAPPFVKKPKEELKIDKNEPKISQPIEKVLNPEQTPINTVPDPVKKYDLEAMKRTLEKIRKDRDAKA